MTTIGNKKTAHDGTTLSSSNSTNLDREIFDQAFTICFADYGFENPKSASKNSRIIFIKRINRVCDIYFIMTSAMN